MRLEVRSRKSLFGRGEGGFVPLPSLLTSSMSACRKLFVHRHNASLFESSREKSAVLTLRCF